MSVFTVVSPTGVIGLRERYAGPVESEYRDLADLTIEQARDLVRHLTESIALATARRKERATKTLADAEARLRGAQAEVDRLRALAAGEG